MIKTMGYETDNEGRKHVGEGSEERTIVLREKIVKKINVLDTVGSSPVLLAVLTGVPT
jgi:hypothetical protein